MSVQRLVCNCRVTHGWCAKDNVLWQRRLLLYIFRCRLATGHGRVTGSGLHGVLSFPHVMHIASKGDPKSWGLGLIGPRLLRPQGPWTFQAPWVPGGHTWWHTFQHSRARYSQPPRRKWKFQPLSWGQVHTVPGRWRLASAYVQTLGYPLPPFMVT